MKNTLRRLAVFLMSIGVVMVAVAAVAALDDSQPNDPTGYLRGKINVEGCVVDEEGSQLAGVTMDVRKATFVGDPVRPTVEKRWRQVVDGCFELECEACTRFDVLFYKEGYFDLKRSWGMKPDGTTGKELIDEGIEIVLELKPVPVDTIHYSGSLLLDATGVKEIVALGKRYQGTQVLRADKTMDSLSEPFVRLVAERDAEGAFLTQDRPVAERKGVTRTAPVGARLHFSGPHDGLVPYDPKGEAKTVGDVYREMREAPASGYQSTIDFDKLEPRYRAGFYFYCRIDGKYGKGFISGPYFMSMNSFKEVGAQIDVKLNPDGSRNVTTHD
jgi:hypothetical protein